MKSFITSYTNGLGRRWHYFRSEITLFQFHSVDNTNLKIRYGFSVIIAGSRSINDLSIVENAVLASSFLPDIGEVVSGTARGVDRLGEQWAQNMGIPIKSFPAEWDKYGKSAGYRRNKQMAEYADALIAIWDGESKGTAHMIKQARDLELMVYVHEQF